MKKTIAIVLLIVLALSLTACGGSNKSAPMEPQAAPALKGDYAMEEFAAEAPAAMDTAANSLAGAGETGSSSLPENRKWIVTVHMDAETEDLDSRIACLDAHIVSMNGYVEDQEIYNGSSYASRRHRNANLTIRIPAEDVNAFTEAVSGIANVVSTNVSRDDITLTYVATESKVTALKTEETRLLELMAKAETMSDLLEIEARLTDVRYELESVTSQLRSYDNLVNYATIRLYVDEVKEYTSVEEKTFWQRIGSGLKDNLQDLGAGLENFVVFVITGLPYFILIAVIITAVVLVAKAAIKRRKKKKGTEDPQ